MKRHPPIPQLTQPAPNPNPQHSPQIKEARAPPSHNPRRGPPSPGLLEPAHRVRRAGEQVVSVGHSGAVEATAETDGAGPGPVGLARGVVAERVREGAVGRGLLLRYADPERVVVAERSG